MKPVTNQRTWSENILTSARQLDRKVEDFIFDWHGNSEVTGILALSSFHGIVLHTFSRISPVPHILLMISFLFLGKNLLINSPSTMPRTIKLAHAFAMAFFFDAVTKQGRSVALDFLFGVGCLQVAVISLSKKTTTESTVNPYSSARQLSLEGSAAYKKKQRLL